MKPISRSKRRAHPYGQIAGVSHSAVSLWAALRIKSLYVVPPASKQPKPFESPLAEFRQQEYRLAAQKSAQHFARLQVLDGCNRAHHRPRRVEIAVVKLTHGLGPG